MNYLKRARDVIDTEIRGLQKVRDDLGDSFVQLVDLCLKTIDGDGKLVLCGVGKSGHIGHKLAATLASTGSPATFMHPVEAMHGDLGFLTSRDLLIALSYSGETEELLNTLPAAKRFNIPIVAITGDADSRLAEWSDLVVAMPVPEEACPFNLAPTTTTTALLALGDALAMVLLDARGFGREDYARLHPSGAIGRSLTLRILDITRAPERTAIVDIGATVNDAVLEMTARRAGSAIIVDTERKLVGIFTDGDFRRHVQATPDALSTPVTMVMTADPVALQDTAMAIEVLTLLEQREIDDIPVIDDCRRVVGVVDIQDLPRFKLM